jgi:hypothetical protein
MRWFTILPVLLCVATLVGCADQAAAIRANREARDAHWRQEKAKAEILELYRDCLRKKQTDPKVDCAEFRTTIEIRERK